MLLHSPHSLVCFQHGLSLRTLRKFNLSDFLINFTNADPGLGTTDQTSVLRKKKTPKQTTSAGCNESQPAPKSTQLAVVKKIKAVPHCVTYQR